MRRTILMWTFAALLGLAGAAATPSPAAAGAPAAAARTAMALPAQAEPIPAPDGGDEPVAPRNMRPYWHVFAAFGLAWTLLLGYALSLGRRFGRLDDEVRRLGGRAD